LSKGVKIEEVLRLVNDALEKIYPDKNIEISTEISNGALFRGDENDLMEVFGNLLDNAYKHAESRICIRTLSSDKGIEISVEDDGPGLNTSEPEKVFKRGERLDQKGFGQGIGLSVVQDIVQSYEGTISAGKSELGGALFKIQFNNKEN
jgi:two-component system sensor histidine kinase PhoQ